MANLVPCKSCGKDVSKSAKSCPHCGHKLKGSIMKKLFFWPLGIFIGLIVLAVIFGEENNSGSVTKSGSGSNQESEALAVGDFFQTRNFEISISDIQLHSSVGGQYFSSQPSEGALYVAVQWNYKNISDKPIGPFSTPSIKLKDANGTSYSADIGASSSYATELDIDSKVLSDLNPGIRVRDGDVFEVSEEAFDMETWTLFVDADQNAAVKLQ